MLVWCVTSFGAVGKTNLIKGNKLKTFSPLPPVFYCIASHHCLAALADYSCAIQKDILVHGRLYVSQNYLCFHANIIVYETRFVLRWKDVTSISMELRRIRSFVLC